MGVFAGIYQDWLRVEKSAQKVEVGLFKYLLCACPGLRQAQANYASSALNAAELEDVLQNN